MLTAEATPRLNVDRWKMSIDGLVDRPSAWTWDEIHQLPASEYRGAIYCVTTWSKFDTGWEGVMIDDVFAAAGIEPPTQWMMAHSFDG